MLACAWRRAAPVFAAALAVSACTVGPNFKPPSDPAGARYTAPGEAMVSNAGSHAPRQTIDYGATVTRDWWTMFHSSALDGVVRQAIAGSPTLDSAKAHLAASREAVASASSAFYPQVGFNSSITREKVSPTGFGLSPSSFPLPPNFNLFQVGLTASYAVDLFGATKRRVEAQQALAAYQGYQLDAAYLSLTGNTVMQAIQVAAIRAQVKAIDQTVAIDQQNLKLVQTERDAGAVPDSDVVLAATQLASDQALRPGLDQQLSVAKHALSVLLGRAPGDWLAPDFDLTGLTLPQQLPVSLPSALVHQRPDILAAEADLHAASAQVGMATAQLYPAITLSGSAGLEGLDPGHLFNPEALIWSVAAGLAQPVFDGGLRRAERREALDNFKASAADYRQTVLEAFGQVADLLQALSHDADLLATEQRALDQAGESVRLQRLNYTNGGTGILNLLDAQRLYQQSLLGYVRAQAQRYQDSVQLLVAMGGGWWDAKLETAAAD